MNTQGTLLSMSPDQARYLLGLENFSDRNPTVTDDLLI